MREPECIVSKPECIVREPEYIVREPESNYKGVGARNQWLLGVESESMTGVMGWSQRLGLQSQELWAGATEDMLEPEAMVQETESMIGVIGWSQSQSLWCKSQRLWCRSQSL